MSKKIYYHGTNKKFNSFDLKYSKCSGLMYFSPCKNLSLAFVGRNKGYLYTVEIDESITVIDKQNCGCIGTKDLNKVKILNIESVSYQNNPMLLTKCNKIVNIINRNNHE